MQKALLPIALLLMLAGERRCRHTARAASKVAAARPVWRLAARKPLGATCDARWQRSSIGRRGLGVLQPLPPPPPPPLAADVISCRPPRLLPLAAPATASARELQAVKPPQFAASLYDALVIARFDSFRGLVDVSACRCCRCTQSSLV